jgi:hypothetical protein
LQGVDHRGALIDGRRRCHRTLAVVGLDHCAIGEGEHASEEKATIQGSKITVGQRLTKLTKKVKVQ